MLSSIPGEPFTILKIFLNALFLELLFATRIILVRVCVHPLNTSSLNCFFIA